MHNARNSFVTVVLSPKHWLVSMPCALLLLAMGCSNERSMGEVRGQVTLDGQPLDEGTIRFSPVDGQSATTGGDIKDGAFVVSVPVAKLRVEISSTKMPAGATAAGRHSDGFIPIVQRIPAKYNTNSELVLDAKPGLNEPRFDLQSQ